MKFTCFLSTLKTTVLFLCLIGINVSAFAFDDLSSSSEKNEQLTSFNGNCGPSFAVCGIVFNDRNANGVQDFGDAQVRARVVNLLDNGTNQVLQSVTTNRQGQYSFQGLATGITYRVAIQPRAGWTELYPNAVVSPTFTFTNTNNSSLCVDLSTHDATTALFNNNTCDNVEVICATTEINLTTGVDHSTGSLFPAAASDTYWRLVNVPPNSNASVGDNALVIGSPNGAWQHAPAGSQEISRWIGPTSNGNDPFSTCIYTYQRYFTTCAQDWSQFNFTVFADNTVIEVRVDGTVIETFPSSDFHFRDANQVQEDLLLTAGRHCLEIDVRNIGGPLGFKLEGSIFGESLVEDDCLSLGNCDAIIPLAPAMMRNGIAGGLVNEQAIAGDPQNGQFGSPAAPWHNACWPSPCPAEVDILDLDGEHDLCGVYLYYYGGTAPFEIDYWDATTAGWVNIFNAPLSQDIFVPINATTESLRFTNNRHADVSEMVLYGTASYLRDSHIIPTNTGMISNNNNAGVPSNLFDERGNAGDPINGLGGTPSTWWSYPCWNNCPPVSEELDLNRLYKIDAISMFDLGGTAPFIVEYDDNGTWVTIFNGVLSSFNSWLNLINLNIYTSKLRFTNTHNNVKVAEVILYGRVAHCPPTNAGNNLQISTSTLNPDYSVQGTISLFPNPTGDNVSLNIPEPSDKPSLITVYSLTGQEVLRQELGPGVTSAIILTNTLPSGTYVLQLTAENGQFIEKIIKE
ncbi:MAG: SdrD B-like domain-containing protein [Bacteroidota bacterium]